ncbi:MAG: AI-2E family transporter [Deltaproteobacteria bacterium]|jgi:predicted PurR-regulated permease PerM|nr:AI-2E family transporter [Deltaproteobacteria bacterium]
MNKQTLDNFDSSFKLIVFHYRKLLIWGVVLGLLVWLCLAVQEIAFLFVASYGISLLLDPLVTRLETKGIARSVSILALMFLLIFILVLVVILAIPVVIEEYQNLVNIITNDFANISYKIEQTLLNLFGIELELNLLAIFENFKERALNSSAEQRQELASIVKNTLFKGYSATLTILNLIMTPFFVFYMTRDLDKIHIVVGNFLPENIRHKVAITAQEVLNYVYAFFKGQLTVGIIMAFLYSITLWIAGVHFAFLIGFIAGILGIVPYLGVILGLLIAFLVTTIYNPSWSQYFYVVLAFIIPNLLESFVLQPKIVGKSVGFNPFTVIIILLIGGQLFGLLGLLLAIPVAAAIMVILRNIFKEVGIQTDHK